MVAAAMAFLSTPAVGAAVGNTNNLAARSAELDARAAEALEVRAAALVCQFGGVKACSVEARAFLKDNREHLV